MRRQGDCGMRLPVYGGRFCGLAVHQRGNSKSGPQADDAE